MLINKTLEQHIAVFGESGSGKTVMLSSFYGAAQEPEFAQQNLYRIVADDFGQGSRLHKNYLGMREDSRTPMTDHFAATSYTFTLKLKQLNVPNQAKVPFDALKLVWHDYPGEWFDHAATNEQEEERRLETFANLLHSDVALVLVDSQELLDSQGEEERYLKSLIGNFKNSLLGLQDGLLDNGKRNVRFPRIWMFGLSKCDLLPEYDVFNFRDLLIEKVAGEINELKEVIGGFIEGQDALSVGEDFVLLSSAKFDSGRIELRDRVGIDLVLPLASALPFQRHLNWAGTKVLPVQVGKELLGSVRVAASLIKRYEHRLPIGLQKAMLYFKPDQLEKLASIAGVALENVQKNALEKKNYFAAILSGFQLDLEQAEKDSTLLRSNR